MTLYLTSEHMQYSYLQIRNFLISKGVPQNETIALTSELTDMAKSKGWFDEFLKTL